MLNNYFFFPFDFIKKKRTKNKINNFLNSSIILLLHTNRKNIDNFKQFLCLYK